MKIHQEKKLNLYFYGYSLVTKNNHQDVTAFWEELKRTGQLAMLFMHTQSLTAVGIVDEWQTDGHFRYRLGVIVTEPHRTLATLVPEFTVIEPQIWNVLQAEVGVWQTTYQLWQGYRQRFGEQYPKRIVEYYQFPSIKSKRCYCELWW
ncbi:MAG: hypothetical protein ACRDCC_11720 [Culicoidibacterales bacterium]